MPPLGFAIATLALGNLFSKTGWAEWFPWSIVPALIGMLGKPVEAVPVGSFVVIAATFVIGVAATIAQLRVADNAQ
jgi:ABC-2 type transport system permease protein